MRVGFWRGIARRLLPEPARNVLRRGSLARHLLVRLLPPILALVCVDIGATWVLTHKLDASSWALEDVFWFMVTGQLASLLLFAWILIVGVRSGLKGVTDLSDSLGEREADDLQPLPADNLPLEIAPLVERTNELLARLDASMAAQRRFIGQAAHQFRTPLSGLKLESELMLARSLPEDIEARARRIKSVTDRMIRLGQQLLVLARVDPGVRPQDSFVSMDLCEWVRHSGARWLSRARDGGLELDLIAPVHPVWIDGDPLLLDELLGNLIDNALRYATGATMLRLRIGSTPPVLVIEDDGVGMALEEQEKVFEAFYRGPGAKPGGAGLGLAIVREIAVAHGAWWRLESRPTLAGTRFSIVFPGPRKGTILNRQERRKWESSGS